MTNKIDSEIVEKVSQVARLNLSNQEKKKFENDLNSILTAFEKLDECDVENTEPTFQPVDVKNVTRKDEKKDCFSQQKALNNTEHKEDGFFKGPRAV